MKIVVGLGNPGNQYKDTRHNIGFLVVDELARRWNTPSWKRRYDAEVSEHRAIGPVLLVKPQTFMNLSGNSVREAAKFYKTPSTDIVVIHDDLDLPAGRLRIRERGGSGGHRGIESMLTQLGADDFVRVRFGVGRPPEGWESADYVLGRFAPDEQSLIKEAIDKAADAVETILREGTAPAMNRFNH
ncbi:MAG: aminoacyl-tRNA hydrolase [Negativicutes bacterium]